MSEIDAIYIDNLHGRELDLDQFSKDLVHHQLIHLDEEDNDDKDIDRDIDDLLGL